MDRIKQIQDYYNSDRISQSLLKALLTGIGTYKKTKDLYTKKDEHFLIGSGVDCILSTPEIFNDLFHISNINKLPSETVSSIIKEVVNCTDKEDINDLRDMILISCNLHKYYSNRTDDSRIDDIISKGKEYFDLLISSKDKDVLSITQYELITTIVNSFKTHPHTSSYFECLLDEEILYQLPIYFDYLGLECKALLDFVKINHTNKTIQPVDIKTIGSSTKSFTKQAERFRYDIQASFYTLAISIYRDSLYKGYKILPFKFLVESTTSPTILPLCYTITNETLMQGSNGCIYNGKEVKGYHQALELYRWHRDNNIWHIDKDIYLANGQLDLQCFKTN